MSKCSSIYRENISAKIISITGSCGKTTLKEMIAYALAGISKTSYSPKSYNNKYGVPLSIFNLKQKLRKQKKIDPEFEEIQEILKASKENLLEPVSVTN